MDLKKTALIIVDMQNDFVHDEGVVKRASRETGVPETALQLLKEPVPNIKKLADFFRKNGKKVIYLYMAWEPDYSDVAIPLTKLPPNGKESGALVKGSWGARIIDELTPDEHDITVRKTGYGGFFRTPLDRVLRNLDIKTIVLSGVATNFCVETTAREAVAYGYDVIFVDDATATFDPEAHQATLKVITMGFGDVMSTDEVIEKVLSPNNK
jgi:ureidoacrylate peracid hydrolase